MPRDIYELNDEMVAAGVRIFVAGLSPASSARSLRAQPLETKKHIGGFWVLEALIWMMLWRGRRNAAVAWWYDPRAQLPAAIRHISDPQIPLTRLKKWNSCRFLVS